MADTPTSTSTKNNNTWLWVIVIIIVLVIAYFVLNRVGEKNPDVIYVQSAPTQSTVQPFVPYLQDQNFPGQLNDYESEFNPELQQYWMDPNAGIRPYQIDLDTCSPKCCGPEWPTPFEGLSPEQISQKISTESNPGPFVRTDMTCANGPGGQGCPCINTNQYQFLTNHGIMPDYPQQIEPSFIIPGDLSRNRNQDDLQSAREQLATSKSPFSRYRKLNDMQRGRSPISNATMANVSGVGASTAAHEDFGSF